MNARSLLLTLLAVSATASAALAAPVKNVIFMIGDGMGLQQIKAANQFLGEPLVFELLPYQGLIATHSADNSVTDSAAAGTAYATGHKVNNGVISQARPANPDYAANGDDMLTMLEHFKALDRSTGLVTTTYITHATPAAFGAHTYSRENYSEIANDYLTQSRPNVLLGGGANGMSPSAAAAAGYTVVSTLDQMQALDTDTETMVSGQFGTGYLPYEYDGTFGGLPHLADMTASALDILDKDPDGFFLMVEGGTIDQSCHDNNIRRAIQETIEFNNSVQLALDWAAGRKDTLVIVTADHETGGLSVLNNPGVNAYPSVSWSTGNHTGANVGVFAWGPNAELISGVMDNTYLFEVATAVIHTRLVWDELGPGNWTDARWTGDTTPVFPDETVDVEVKTDVVSLATDVAALTLSVTSGELMVESTGSLSVIQDATISAGGSLNLAGALSARSFGAAGMHTVASGAQLSVADTLTVDSPLDLTGATLSTEAGRTKVVINPTGGISLGHTLCAATLSVAGSLQTVGADLGSLSVAASGQMYSSGNVAAADAVIGGALRLTDGAVLHAATMTIDADNGGSVDTGTGGIEISESLRIGDNRTLGVAGATFRILGSNLADTAQRNEIVLSGGQFSLAGGAAAPSGAIALWKLDEGVGAVATDTSMAGNDHVGSIVGATWVDDPEHGTVLSFDGAGDVLQAAAVSDLQLGSPNTLAMWINTSQKGGKLLGKGNGDPMWFLGEKALSIDGTTGAITLIGRSAGELTGTTDVADGHWHHVVVTYDGSTTPGGQEVYVDGVLDTANRTFAGGSDTGSLFRLGTSDLRQGQDYAGLLDDFYFFNRSLAADEVAELYASFGGGAEDLPNTDFHVTADSAMLLESQQDLVALGNVTIEAGVVLTIDGAGARLESLAAGHLVSVSGDLVVAGTLSPGKSRGTLSVLGDLTLNDGAVYVWDLGESSGDLVVVEGDLTLADGWTLRLADAGGLCDAAQQFDLFTCTGTLSMGQGTIDVSAIEASGAWDCTGATILQDGGRVYLAGLTVVPEPGMMALMGTGLLSLLGVCLRRRQH